MSKKAELPLYLIVSVTITIVGILLVFAMINSKSNLSKKIYCQSVYKFKNLQGERRDTFCDEYLNLGLSMVEGRKYHNNKFASMKENVLLDFTSGPQIQHIILPQDAAIINASMRLSLTGLLQNNFTGGSLKQSLYYNQEGGSRTMTFEKPEGDIIDAKVELLGKKWPGKADLVFVIDTSESMANEWSALCGIISELEELLLNRNVNLSLEIYGTGTGPTHGTCFNTGNTIPNQWLIESDPPMIYTQVGIWHMGGCAPWAGGPVYCNAETRTAMGPDGQNAGVIKYYDDPREAWAKGAIWVLNNHSWRNASKRIIIPIGDSDPTGGGPVYHEWRPPVKGKWRYSSPWNPPYSSGTEQPAVDLLIELASQAPGAVVIPVYGDASGGEEGMHVGIPNCRELYPQTCGLILDWMDQVAQGTSPFGAEAIGYTNQSALRDALFNVLISPFPENVSVYVDGILVEEYNYQLNDQNCPKVLNITQNVIDCTGNCTIEVLSESQGSVMLDGLRIKYEVDPEIDNIKLGNTDIMPQIAYPIDIRDAITDYLEQCNTELCSVPVEFTSLNPGMITVNSINVDYLHYSPKLAIFEKIIDCWNRVGFGEYDENYLCEEVSIPYYYKFDKDFKTVTESNITDILIKKNWCTIMSNSDLGCGTEDNLAFRYNVVNTSNVLIEYDARTKQIVVS